MKVGFENSNPNAALSCLVGAESNDAWWMFDSCVIGQLWQLNVAQKEPIQSCQMDCNTSKEICWEDATCRKAANCWHNCDAEDYICQGGCQEMADSNLYWMNVKGCMVSCLLEHFNDGMGNQVVKNLLFIGKYFYSNPTLQVLTTQDAPISLEDGIEEDEIPSKFNTLHWLFRRLSFIARKGETKQKIWVFRWFAAMVTQIEDLSTLESFLIPVLVPMYRVAEKAEKDEKAEAYQSEELKQLNEEVKNAMDIIKQRIGADSFFAVLGKIVEQVKNLRLKRKQTQLFQAAINPEKTMKKKQKQRQHKKDLKRRKTETKVF